ncbi:MAG: hypothetical protein RJQ09_10220 [Cyclobacteriaceae bacterium]
MKKLFTIMMMAATITLTAQNKELPIIFPEELEIELALSSLPAHLRADAAVYVFKRKLGYVKVKDGTNGFTALVERPIGFPTSFAPVSFDEEGTKTHIPRIFDQGKWMEESKSVKEIQEMVREKFATNQYGIPKTTGISYMLSPLNILPSPTGKPAWYYPHYMIYASYVKKSDLGLGKFSWHTDAPMLLDQGPHGLLVVRMGIEESNKIKEQEKDLIFKMEKFLGKKLSSFEIAMNHDH